MAEIKSPIEGFAGRTAFGSVELEFVDGVAQVDDTKLNDGHRAYLERRGYTLTEGEAGDDVFDPAKHNGGDIQEYLKTADQAEVDRLREAEAQGKDRKGVKEAIEARSQELAEAAQTPQTPADATGADGDQNGGE